MFAAAHASVTNYFNHTHNNPFGAKVPNSFTKLAPRRDNAARVTISQKDWPDHAISQRLLAIPICDGDHKAPTAVPSHENNAALRKALSRKTALEPGGVNAGTVG